MIMNWYSEYMLTRFLALLEIILCLGFPEILGGLEILG